MSHLTTEDIQQYTERRLPPERLIAMDRHLDGCEPCRGVLAEAAGAGELSMQLRSKLSQPRHPATELLVGYTEGSLSPSEREQVGFHLMHCDRCRADAADLESINRHFEEPPSERIRGKSPSPALPRAAFRWALGFGALACAAIGGAIGVVVEHDREADRRRGQVIAHRQVYAELEAARSELQRTRSLLAKRPSQEPAKQAAPATPPLPKVAGSEKPVSRVAPAVTVRDGSGLLRMDAEGGAEWVRPLPAVAATAIREGVLQFPRVIARLTVPVETVRSADAATPGVSGLAPAATVVNEERPMFRWAPVEAAESYEVTLQPVTMRDAPVIRSGPVTGLSWQPEAPLRRGEIYVWQVTAARAGGELLETLPPKPRFGVADASLQARVEQIRRDYAGSHLALGVLLAAEGLLDEAEAELLRAGQANPKSRIVRRLLEQVAQRRRPASPEQRSSHPEGE